MLELKNTVTEIRNAKDGFKGRWHLIEGKDLWTRSRMKRKSPNQSITRKKSERVEQIGRSNITLISKFLLGIGVPRRNGSHCRRKTAGRDKDSKFPKTNGRHHQATELRSRAPSKQDRWGGGPQEALRSLGRV